jgi:RHS repeat-associated protein
MAVKYDGLSNLTSSHDDSSARYDRSLGAILGYGSAMSGPNQLHSADGLQAHYDESGNLTELKIERPGYCRAGQHNRCAQWFAYDWDEVGQLARARRWDFDGNTIPSQIATHSLPSGKLAWDLSYAYLLSQRVRKSLGEGPQSRHTLEIFDTLRLERASIEKTSGDYQASRENTHVYLGSGLGHVFWDTQNKLAHQVPGSNVTMHLAIEDRLGSNSIVINHASGELVERTTYLPYGAVESDFRPERWNSFREDYKFTGKEEDIEVGIIYFGARYYQPYLGLWASADPLSIHGVGGDVNPYSYVGGRVTRFTDPLGLEPCQDINIRTCLTSDHKVEQTGEREFEIREPEIQKPQPAEIPSQPTLGGLLERGADAIDRAVDIDQDHHVTTGNLAKAAWNSIIGTAQAVALTSPLTWYSAHKLGENKASVSEKPGDISQEVVFVASVAIPGPGGKGGFIKSSY